MGLRATAIFRPRSGLGQFIQAVVTPAVRASVQAGLDTIQQAAQALCPVDTGALRDSITTNIEDLGTTIRGSVGPTMPYASYVEYGTGRLGSPAPYPHVMSWPGMKAQPYMRPAYDENKDAIIDLFRAQLGVAFSG
jgi:HK97 gp10 family phage protein